MTQPRFVDPLRLMTRDRSERSHSGEAMTMTYSHSGHRLITAVMASCALATGCGPDESDTYYDGVSVYIGGRAVADVPVVWKNGAKLSGTGPEIVTGLQGGVTGLAAADGALYASVHDGGGLNGRFCSRSAIVAMGIGSYAMDVAVAGGYAYVVGGNVLPGGGASYWVLDASTTTIDASNDGVPDVEETAPDPVLLAGDSAYGTAIAVSGSDVVAGGQTRNASNGYVASVWFNGVRSDLTDGTRSAQIEDIALSGSDVYAAGAEASTVVSGGLNACYWRNGTKVDLSSDPAQGSVAYAIAIDGSDVYVAGFEGTTPCYWKNGVRIDLPSGAGADDSRAEGIAVIGGTVYVAGTVFRDDPANGVATHYPCLWRNGEQRVMGDTGSTLDLLVVAD